MHFPFGTWFTMSCVLIKDRDIFGRANSSTNLGLNICMLTQQIFRCINSKYTMYILIHKFLKMSLSQLAVMVLLCSSFVFKYCTQNRRAFWTSLCDVCRNFLRKFEENVTASHEFKSFNLTHSFLLCPFLFPRNIPALQSPFFWTTSKY